MLSVNEASVKSFKPNWKNSSPEEKIKFTDTLGAALDNVDIPISVGCDDPSCDKHEHKADSDDYVEEVLNAISVSATESLPWILNSL